MKPFLIIAGEYYYPEWKTKNWIKTYETLEEAKKQVEQIPNRFNNKNGDDSYQIYGNEYDWYEIVDLREWIYEEN